MNNEIKKIITYKKDNETSAPNDLCLSDSAKIEQAIITKQYSTRLNTLPLSISLNSFENNFKKFLIIATQVFGNYLNEVVDDLLK